MVLTLILLFLRALIAAVSFFYMSSIKDGTEDLILLDGILCPHLYLFQALCFQINDSAKYHRLLVVSFCYWIFLVLS